MATVRTETYLAAQAARVQLGDTLGDRTLIPDLIESVFDRIEESDNPLRTIADQGTDVATLSAAELLSGLIEGTPGAARDYTTDTAAAIVAALANAQVGSSFEFYINNKDGSNTITLVAGDGVTLDGTLTIAPGVVRKFIGTVTNATAASEAVTIWGVV